VRALIEDGLPGANIAQVGLAPSPTAAMHAMRSRRAIWSSPSARSAREGIDRAIGRALDHVAPLRGDRVDCDIDVIDRAQFPGAPGARPGGMAAHDFFIAVRGWRPSRRCG
jgi:formiminoglutamase